MGQEYVRNINIISTVPREVEPIYFEDFDWHADIEDKAGDGKWIIERDPNVWQTGRASLHLMPEAITPANKTARFDIFPALTESKLVETMITFLIDGDDATNFMFTIYCELVDAENGGSHSFYFRLNGATGNFEVDSGAGYVVVGAFPATLVVGTWYTLRLFTNLMTHNWVSMEFQGTDIDLSAHDFFAYNAAAYRNRLRFVYMTTHETYMNTIFIDKIVVRGLDKLPI